MPIHISEAKLSPEEQAAWEQQKAYLRERYKNLPDRNSVESFDEAVTKLRLRDMAELIRQRAGDQAADRFIALGEAHLKGGAEGFREKFKELFPEK